MVGEDGPPNVFLSSFVYFCLFPGLRLFCSYRILKSGKFLMIDQLSFSVLQAFSSVLLFQKCSLFMADDILLMVLKWWRLVAFKI
jgi:hypothetical protein